MKSNIIMVTNQGVGFDQATLEARKVADYQGLGHKNSVQLQLITEEMLSMISIVTGEISATFWIEASEKEVELHISTKAVLDKTQRAELLSAATSRKNEAANSFLGKLRDAFEQAMASGTEQQAEEIPEDVAADISGRFIEETAEWDGYESSTLKKLADKVKIFIRGNVVDMTVTKVFE